MCIYVRQALDTGIQFPISGAFCLPLEGKGDRSAVDEVHYYG